MSDTHDVEELRQISENLAAATRELRETAASIADAVKMQSSSTVTINAGGIASGVALAGVGMCVVLYVLFGVWVLWLEADRKAQQEAWMGVWRQNLAELAESHRKENEHAR